LIIARFMPVVRTFAPIIAGIGEMRYRSFLFYNVTGGIIWGTGLPLLGYELGNRIPDIDRYVLPILAAIIVVSILPSALHLWRDHRKQKKSDT
jgi:membrane-associated protein